jgi:uncharacterized protein YwgA
MRAGRADMPLLELLIPLYLISLAGKQFKGRTRLQKLVFLVQKKVGGAIDYEFAPAGWGPLSFRLYNITKRLRSLGMIDENVKRTPSGNVVVCFSITSEGKAFLDLAMRRQVVPKHIKREIEDVNQEYGGLPIIRLLREVHEKYPEFVDESQSLR